MTNSFLLFLSSSLIFHVSQCSSEISDFRMRKQFHNELCRRRPTLSSCDRPFTITDYREELSRERGETKVQDNDDDEFKTSRRSDWVDDEMDDQDFEYYMWRKRRRHWLRKQMEDDNDRPNVDYHYHYHQSSPYSGYYYPRYSSYYPQYSGYGYGGYGGGLLGGLFNIGISRSIGISTPIGGFGYQSGIGLGIGK